MLSEKNVYDLDVSQVVPEAREIVRAAAAVYLHHLGPWCIGVIVHGSAMKGGYIPGCSDIDFQLYLEPSAFTKHNQLPLERCLALQRDLAQIDPSPFQYIQGYALPPVPRKGYVGPIPRAYHVVIGVLPIPDRHPIPGTILPDRVCFGSSWSTPNMAKGTKRFCIGMENISRSTYVGQHSFSS